MRLYHSHVDELIMISCAYIDNYRINWELGQPFINSRNIITENHLLNWKFVL